LVRYLSRHGLLSTLFLTDMGLMLLSIFLFILALDYPDMARTFPSLVMMMIVVVTIMDMVSIVRAGRKKKSSGEKSEQREGAIQGQQLKALYMVVLMFIFYLFMVFFGLALGTLLFLLLSGWTLGYRKLKYLMLSSLIITAFVYIIFRVILNSFLPEGLIFAVMRG